MSWEWREGEGERKADAGVIAQEVEEVFPEFIGTDERGFKTVNYTALVGVLIEAVKELDARLVALEERVR